MKNILRCSAICAGLALGLLGCQTTVYEPVEVTQVVNVPNHPKSEIYNKTRQWFSQYFVSGDSVVDYEDKETGTIIGNAIASNGSDPFGLIKYDFEYNIRIDTKDNKFRAVTKIVRHRNTDSSKTYDVLVVPDTRRDDAERKVGEIVKNIESYVLDQKLSSEADW
ncbi:DUF4468 domain-containing protein [Vibrio vulnificus]|uniref:DUF4468 domain-containing protein n=1 Tax=Vibrio vulnificus TaxID=672 RepID=UPI0010235623|nr:DUF4468 domain-containing protein [Vibrio vulnificus]EGQ8093351.1 DUF4468 domain-containing protein [Vibrio vulnificus]EHH0747178.1 DUF4468 domain-containing protein [Vibrio vulnificus]EIH0733628.1 DUF4468 domain-containing protein [Vibrio vulnificus]EIH1439272.1 DUF4468 domain-containing protein [Vibrio vulnificus]EIU7615311.1 DUF4468 domain-containing protein [Vibrio vulnificus]